MFVLDDMQRNAFEQQGETPALSLEVYIIPVHICESETDATDTHQHSHLCLRIVHALTS